MSHWDLYAMLRVGCLALKRGGLVTVGLNPGLDDQLASFSPLTLLVGSSGVLKRKPSPKMTYTVSSVTRCTAVLMLSIVCTDLLTLVVLWQNENVKSVRDALEQLVCKESLQGYTCTKSKLEVSSHLFLIFVISRHDHDVYHRNANDCHCYITCVGPLFLPRFYDIFWISSAATWTIFWLFSSCRH